LGKHQHSVIASFYTIAKSFIASSHCTSNKLTLIAELRTQAAKSVASTFMTETTKQRTIPWPLFTEVSSSWRTTKATGTKLAAKELITMG